MKKLAHLLIIIAMTLTVSDAICNPQKTEIIENKIKKENITENKKEKSKMIEISDELKLKLYEAIKKDYIIFHEQVIGELPKANLHDKHHHIKEYEDKADVFIGVTFDKKNLAILSKIQTNNEKNNDIINNILKQGVIPFMYSDDASKEEIENIKIEKIFNLSHKNTYKTEIIFRGEAIETYYIFDSKHTEGFQRTFSISRKMFY